MLQTGRLLEENANQALHNEPEQTTKEIVNVEGTVKINIGGSEMNHLRSNLEGSTFEVEKTLLFKEPSCLFAQILSGKFPFALSSDCIFIDRDPTHFPTILSYLRSSTFTTPDSELAREQLLKDAQFYNISSLIPLLSSINKQCFLLF